MSALAAQPGGKLKRARASLIGGIAVGICVAVLWALIAREAGAGAIVAALGLPAGAAIGAWIRIADL